MNVALVTRVGPVVLAVVEGERGKRWHARYLTLARKEGARCARPCAGCPTTGRTAIWLPAPAKPAKRKGP